MIQAYDGLFGMESQMWERIKDNNLDYAEENLGAFQAVSYTHLLCTATGSNCRSIHGNLESEDVPMDQKGI